MFLRDLAVTVHQKRVDLGLSQKQLADLSGLSRQTIVSLEAGTLEELGVTRLEKVLSVLGLQFGMQDRDSDRPQRVTDPLVLAARSASTSYRDVMPAIELGNALAHGSVPVRFRAHMATLLNELSPQLLVQTVKAAAFAYHMPPKKIWKNLSRLGHELQTTRRL
jgi:transcriptional regulator with XRE-family HTH domain